jgi:hypothetical protein
VAILQPNKESLTFEYVDGHLKPKEHNEILERDVAAFVHVLHDLYDKKIYRAKE